MASLSLDVNPWNLTAVLVTALGAGCGPAIQLDDAGGTDGVDDGSDNSGNSGNSDNSDNGVTVPPGPQCEVNADCASGFFCDAGTCVEEPYSDDYYCDDGGCCDGGGCCYDGGGYGGPGGCNYYYGDCNLDADCEPAQECVGGDPYSGYGLAGYCEPLPGLPECEDADAPELIPLPMSSAGDGNVVALAFVDANADGLPDLVVGREDAASLYVGPVDQPTMPLPLPAGAVLQDAASADVDGDARQDLIVALGEAGFAVLLGDDVGGFIVGFESGADGDSVDHVIAFDYQGDGVVDVVTSGSELAVSFGDGVGGFWPKTPLWGDAIDSATLASPSGSPPTLLAAESNNVREWLTGEGADTETNTVRFSHFAVDPWLPLSAGADATHALLVAGMGKSTSVLEFSSGENTARYASASSFLRDGAAGDMQGDGSEDFLLLGESELTYVAHQPIGSLACQRTYELGDVTELASGDTNGDGRAEIVTASGPDLTLWLAE